jgi:hypothetical protein
VIEVWSAFGRPESSFGSFLNSTDMIFWSALTQQTFRFVMQTSRRLHHRLILPLYHAQ